MTDNYIHLILKVKAIQNVNIAKFMYYGKTQNQWSKKYMKKDSYNFITPSVEQIYSVITNTTIEVVQQESYSYPTLGAVKSLEQQTEHVCKYRVT